MAIPKTNVMRTAVMPQQNYSMAAKPAVMNNYSMAAPMGGMTKPMGPVQGAGGLTGATNPTMYQAGSNNSQGFQMQPGANQMSMSYGTSPRNFAPRNHVSNVQNYDQFRDAAQQQFDRQINPQIEAQNRKFESDMAARGIYPNTKAYNDAYANMSRAQNDLRGQGMYQAMQAGLGAQNQFAQQDIARENMANQYNIAGLNASTSRYGMDMNNAFNQMQLQENARQFGINDLFRTNQLNEGARQYDINDIFRNQQLDQQGLGMLGNLFLGFGNQDLQRQQLQNGFNNQWFNQGAHMLGQAPGNTFVPTTGLTQNSIAAGNNIANANAQAMGGFGSLLGSGLSAAGTAGGFSALFSSDVRLKENIELVGSIHGVPVYEFDYKDKRLGTGRYRGTMAQDIIETHPEALSIESGHFKVDYSKLPIDMEVIA